MGNADAFTRMIFTGQRDRTGQSVLFVLFYRGYKITTFDPQFLRH